MGTKRQRISLSGNTRLFSGTERRRPRKDFVCTQNSNSFHLLRRGVAVCRDREGEDSRFPLDYRQQSRRHKREKHDCNFFGYDFHPFPGTPDEMYETAKKNCSPATCKDFPLTEFLTGIVSFFWGWGNIIEYLQNCYITGTLFRVD